VTDPSSSTRATRGARGLFLAYACVLIVLTHWPRLTLPSEDIPRPDVVVHTIAFAIWSFLCVRAGWFAPRHTARNILLAALTSLAYAAIDEGTQAIPWFQRTCAWDDFAADLLGVGAGLTLALLLAAIDDQGSDSPHGR
jgi:hypothetical protein